MDKDIKPYHRLVSHFLFMKAIKRLYQMILKIAFISDTKWPFSSDL